MMPLSLTHLIVSLTGIARIAPSTASFSTVSIRRNTLSFSTQGLGIIPLGKDGTILYNNISWVDSRARAQADEINAKLGRHEFDAADVLPKYLWIKQNMPKLYEKTDVFTGC